MTIYPIIHTIYVDSKTKFSPFVPVFILQFELTGAINIRINDFSM